MKYLFFLLATMMIILQARANHDVKVYDITLYGAIGNGRKLSTPAINAAIDACAKNGGGIVRIPKGIFITGSIYLKSNIRLHLDEGAVIRGTADIDQYDQYKGSASLAKYNSGDAGPNANSIMNERWGKGLILGSGINNVSIEGQGIIDGIHAFDSLGEEKMRGPHTIILGESRNITITGVTINRSANYAFLAYDIENAGFDNLQINEGWDGIHIRGGKNIVIRNCSFNTGDDAIAGGYWENMVISDCNINSSCNGIRLIMPATRLTIANCTIKGPGKYPHRTSKERNRTNMLSAILLQPGGWGSAPGNLHDVDIHDIEITDMNNPFMVVLNQGNEGDRISFERIKATGIRQAAASIESWQGGVFGNVLLRDISISYIGNSDAGLKNIIPGQPPADSRPLPAWALFARNVRHLQLENVTLSHEGEEARPAFVFDNTGKIEFIKVDYTGMEQEQSVQLKHSSSFQKNQGK